MQYGGAESGSKAKEIAMEQRVSAEHGIVDRLPGERLGYFGWPTVARLDDGTLLVASSGLRSQHVCPWGKTVLHASHDDGRSWTPARIIQDSPIDDRDAGVVNLGGGQVLVSWFTSDTRIYVNENWVQQWLGDDEITAWRQALGEWTDTLVNRWLGSWVTLSEDGGHAWSEAIRVPVSTPHGPIRLQNGDLLYLGKRFVTGWHEMEVGQIVAARSSNGGRNWDELGVVPLHRETAPANYHEPHVVELPSGRLLGVIRIEDHSGIELTNAGIPSFSIMQTVSDDGGYTWTKAKPLGFHGSPPHLLRHSSGTLVLTYGYRQAPFGQRVAFSHDDGASWEHDWIIRDDGPDGDLGYPSTVELADGTLFTVCYQKVPGDDRCSLLWSRWQLP